MSEEILKKGLETVHQYVRAATVRGRGSLSVKQLEEALWGTYEELMKVWEEYHAAKGE